MRQCIVFDLMASKTKIGVRQVKFRKEEDYKCLYTSDMKDRFESTKTNIATMRNFDVVKSDPIIQS